MEAPNPSLVSDGLSLTFYLAPRDLPEGRNGGYYGLFNDTSCSSSYHIVVVEFDTHGSPDNSWDPAYQHIGINVNCLKSEKLTRWDARYYGEVAEVEISYIVSGEVDLKAILPEWVTVGFTGTLASTYRETHDVLNWEFASTLDTNNNVALENKARDIA
ncbi:hypothetical protein RIF29_13859 [Crotalaria pallida]|uniref:Legume lectin domain-containing protein n=1 Tax=Crotalaria pallida TaxID=3830 RepID=A0AAN9FAQ2_CROPI